MQKPPKNPHNYPHNCQSSENRTKLPLPPPIWKLGGILRQKWSKNRVKHPVLPPQLSNREKSHDNGAPPPHLEMWVKNGAKNTHNGPHYAPQLSDCVKNDDYPRILCAIKIHKISAHKRPPFAPQLSDLCDFMIFWCLMLMPHCPPYL